MSSSAPRHDRQESFPDSRFEPPLVPSKLASSSFAPDDDLPTDICRPDQLPLVPPECLSNDTLRPLLHIDDVGNRFHYSLTPMSYAVAAILTVELLERFSFYGIYYTQTLFLTGAYNEDWNAGFSSVQASSFVSFSTLVAYSTPFVGALVSDTLLGDYQAILVGLLCLYLPGVGLVALTTVPEWLGPVFPTKLLTLGVLILWPLGTGLIKSIVNVFGAKQFHPLLQSSLIESYYINFYMSINLGALLGIAIVPVIAQQVSVSVAYFCPFGLLCLGVICFVLGTPRYVCSPPRRRKVASWGCKGCLLFSRKHRRSKRHRINHSHNNTPNNNIPLMTIFRICLLIVPFSVGYNQMPTTFIVQGAVMSKAFHGWVDVASMNSLDALSVLSFGYLTASHIYPALARRNKALATTTKFAIGSTLGALAMLWALFVESKIHHTYHDTHEQVSVLWQAPAYILMGWGEIFAISAAYEVAFTASSPNQKVLASATNIFCVGGVPNVICIGLVHVCSRWFRNARGTASISHIEDYTTAHVGHYFWVLFGIMCFGVVVNMLPGVRRFVSSVESTALELVKTPKMNRPSMEQQRRKDDYQTEESALLLTPKTKRYRDYLEKGPGPVLYKMGSMRAGPALSNSELPGGKVKKVKYNVLPSLYNNNGGNAGSSTTKKKKGLLEQRRDERQDREEVV